MSGSSWPPGGGSDLPPPPPGRGPGDAGGGAWGGGGGGAWGGDHEAGWGGGYEEIPNNLVWAILTTVFCCLPAGIVSIVYAAQVGSKQAAGDIAGARAASRNARTWAIVSAALALIWIPLAVIFFLVAAPAGLYMD